MTGRSHVFNHEEHLSSSGGVANPMKDIDDKYWRQGNGTNPSTFIGGKYCPARCALRKFYQSRSRWFLRGLDWEQNVKVNYFRAGRQCTNKNLTCVGDRERGGIEYSNFLHNVQVKIE